MKRSLLAAAALATVLCAAQLPAGQEATSSNKWVRPDWHYRYHEGHWWYWMPESSKWMVWAGSSWIPQEQFLKPSAIRNVSQATVQTNGDNNSTSEAATTGEVCPPTYSTGRYSAGSYSPTSGGGAAGYGWSWGPGTAFRDGPGHRF